MPRINDKTTRDRRKVEADVRKHATALGDKRTIEQQIAALDARLGVGVGAAKERARLASGG